MALYLGLLFSSAVFRSLAYVLAAPVSVQDASQSKNDSAFQTIATGTQDLAALVGLFATDSVERYSVDYSRGKKSYYFNLYQDFIDDFVQDIFPLQ